MTFNVKDTSIHEVKIIEPQIFEDARGVFFESFNEREFEERVQRGVRFVQDNHSVSKRNVLRGLHYQIKRPQGKLVRVTVGEVFDVAVDLRRCSPSFGCWTGARLSAVNRHQLWIPPGFAHGFIVLSEVAEFLYKTTDFWYPQYERTLLWDDPDIGIKWGVESSPIIAEKDAAGGRFETAQFF